MITDIKPYAQYYIGQPCVNTFFKEGEKEYDRKWRLRGVDPVRPRPYLLMNDAFETYTESIKPILRRLESLNEAEALELYKLYDPEWQGYINRFKAQCPDEAFSALKYIKEGRYANSIYSISTAPAAAFHYLLSLGMDLFGLIDSGLALDAAVVKQQNERND